MIRDNTGSRSFTRVYFCKMFYSTCEYRIYSVNWAKHSAFIESNEPSYCYCKTNNKIHSKSISISDLEDEIEDILE